MFDREQFSPGPIDPKVLAALESILSMLLGMRRFVTK